MKVCITTPETTRPTGNFGTAHQWARIIGEQLGHEVTVTDSFNPEAEVLVAIHARKSADSIRGYREANKQGRRILALAGTDIYPDPCETSIESMKIADSIIMLQDKAILKIPESERDKAVTIIQSATTGHFVPPEQRSRDPFDVCVIGFMREVKDPMRAAWASRKLPEESKIRIRQAGGFIETEYEDFTSRELAENPRYQWLGIISRSEIDELLSASQLMVLSSFHEGGARVLSYAVVNHTPVLAAASDCAISLLGEDWPGLYEPGDTDGLAALMHRAETDAEFLSELREITAKLAPKFAPEKEIEAWKNLL